jgi:hypothetical protein
MYFSTVEIKAANRVFCSEIKTLACGYTYVLVEAPNFRRNASCDFRMSESSRSKNALCDLVNPPFSLLNLSMKRRASFFSERPSMLGSFSSAKGKCVICGRAVV